MVTAQTVDTSLSDADTTAAASFLQGRLEPAGLERRYESDLAIASADIAVAAREAGSDPEVAASLETLSTDLPVYSGIVQDADFNERQGFYPLAAAYISEANNLMRSSILPAAATALRDREQTLGRRPIARGLPAAGDPCGPGLPRPARRPGGSAALAEPPLPPHLERAAGDRHRDRPRTGCLVDRRAHHARPTGVNSALANGSRPVSTFTQARILALRARADDELTLLTPRLGPDLPERLQEHCGGPRAPARRPGVIDRHGGLLRSARSWRGPRRPSGPIPRCTARSGTTIRPATWPAPWRSPPAAARASCPAISSDLNSDLADGITASQSTFVDTTSDAASDLDGLIWGLAVGAVLVGRARPDRLPSRGSWSTDDGRADRRVAANHAADGVGVRSSSSWRRWPWRRAAPRRTVKPASVGPAERRAQGRGDRASRPRRRRTTHRATQRPAWPLRRRCPRRGRCPRARSWPRSRPAATSTSGSTTTRICGATATRPQAN